MTGEDLRSANYSAVGTLSGGIETVGIVDIFVSIHGKPHKEMVFCEELGPFIIDEIAVGLNGMADANAAGIVLFLDFNELAVKIQPSQGGFTALKTDVQRTFGFSQRLLNDGFQSF